MISKKAFSDSLHYFSPSIISEGMYSMRMIIDVSVRQSVIIAEYGNDPSVSPSIYLSDGRISKMQCNCGRSKYCQHLAGMVLFFINNPEMLDNDNGTDRFELTQSNIVIEKLKPHVLLKAGRINTYRQVLDPDTFIDEVEDLGYCTDDYFMGETVETYASHENLLNVAVTEEYHEDEVAAVIQFKWEKGKLYLKCDACKEMSNTLCAHQEWLFLTIDTFWIELFIRRELNVLSQYEKFTKSHPFSLGFLQKHFYIGFYDKNKIYLRSKENLIMVDEDSLEHYEKVFGNPAPSQKEVWLDEMYGKEGENIGSAIMWSRSENRINLNYLEGRLSKDEKKLTAHIRRTEEPAGIPKSLQFDLENINGTKLSFNNDMYYLEISQKLTFLRERMGEWKDYIHYFNTGRFNAVERVRKKDLILFEFAEKPLQMNLEIDESNDGIFISINLDFLTKNKSKKRKFLLHPLFLVTENKAYVYSDISILEFLQEETPGWKFLFPADQKGNARRMVSTLVNKYKIPPENLEEGTVEFPEISQRIIRLSQRNNQIYFYPYLMGTDDETIRVNVLGELCQPATQDPYYIAAPDPEVRREFLEWLRDLHPEMDRRTESLGFYSLYINCFRRNQWFLTLSEICQDAGVIVEGWDDLDGFSFSPHRAEIIQQVESGTDWFDIHFTIRYGDIIVPQKDWIKAVMKGEKSVLLEDGTYGVIPEEWRVKMFDLLGSAEVSQGEIKLSKLHFNIVDQYLEIDAESDIRREIEEKKSRLVHFKEMKIFDLPKGVKADLRPYQKDGFQWLKFLNEYGFGGCLADDMGLGKTLQVLTLLTDVKDNHTAANLIVVPRSLMHNWAAEIEKFSPEMTYLIHHGVQRDKNEENFDTYDIIISTYGTVTNDISWLRKYRFHYVVLDESQAIKNPSSQRYRAVVQLSADHKLTMTGTPVENSTMDLFAQFNFINPGLLGNKTQFRRRFADPIDRHGDQEAKSLLQNIVHPFLLRRTKGQVAKDLPPRTESILYCEMDREQRALYEKMKNEIRAGLLSEANLEQNKIKVLDGLLKLRQICNSPALLDRKNGENKKLPESSVKIDTLMEQIREVVDGENHSVLVFSQFTSMLALVRERLDREGYKYAYLDGSTTRRQEVIDSFNEDPMQKIFLLSLKAGNTGLNLTKADFVYLLDPWWNPAVEAQAIDRTHRIGQTNPVFAYRLICKDTVEEKIIHLQAKKNQLADDLIQTDENVFKTLDKDALISLFE